MMNNQNIINKKYNQQISYQPQRSHYRSSERNNNYSPNVYVNNNNININSLRNPNQNYNMKAKKNNNIYYINPRNNFNQMNSSQNIAVLKQIKSKQHNQIYVEGDLNNFMDNQMNNQMNNPMNNQMEIYSYSNLNRFNNNNVNFNNYIEKQNNNKNRITNVDKTKNNRGIPRKSPIPIPKGYNNNKYLNNDNLSKYSTNSNNASYYTANSQLINNNYSISNLSQISGYSNNSYNNPIHYSPFFDNGHIRSYSNNTHSSITQKKLNGNNSKNKNILSNSKSVNDMLNHVPYNISTYDNKVKTNNYFSKINNNNLINVPSSKKTKYISKSPNIQGDYLSNTIKRKNNNNFNQDIDYNYNNMFNNNIDIGNVNNIINDNLFNKIAYRTSNFGSTYNNNLNLYENYNINNNNNNNNNYNNKNKINYNSRPLSSHSHMTKRRRSNNINMISNNIGINPNNININNYNSNDRNQKQKLVYNNINKYKNIKRDYSANIQNNNRININKINSDLNNNLNQMNQNPMVNLHIINKGQIINNNYNNINNNNMGNMNNMNNYYVYKYNICQNNIIPGKNNNMRNNNNVNNGAEMNINYKDNERKNNHKQIKKNGKIRSNSSSGVGVTGELNNIIIQRENDRNNQIKIVPKKMNSKSKNMNNNSKSKNMKNNMNSTNKKSQNKTLVEKPIRNIHHFTHVGFNGEKDKDFNQDIAFLEKNFTGNNSYLYLGVCDGHGVEGHEVSGFIKNILPKNLSNSLFHKDLLTNDINLKKKLYNIIGETFIKVNEELISNESINSIFSGTTCVSVIYTPVRLICANIGDSRAVLGRFDKNLKKWISINLSRDHKPTEEDEARRIYKKGGRIKPFIDEETGEEVGPQRVWVKDDEVPGLAMTRSFGDRVASIAGTICVPEIKEYNFNEGDKFLIVASDGVWEFIQSEECINIIGKFYFNNNIEGCCEFLYEESRKRWLKEEEVVDDITMLLVFFD